ATTATATAPPPPISTAGGSRRRGATRSRHDGGELRRSVTARSRDAQLFRGKRPPHLRGAGPPWEGSIPCGHADAPSVPARRLHVTGFEPLPTLRTGELRVHGVAARPVTHLDGRAGGAGHPAVAPGQEGDDDRVEGAALLGEAVLEAVGPLRVLPPLQHA